MIKIIFNLSDEKDCERILRILGRKINIECSIDLPASIDELTLTPHLRINILAHGIKTIEQLDLATDTELKTIHGVGADRLRYIRDEIKYWKDYSND